MGFASEYLSCRVLFDPKIKADSYKDTYLIVIIPACNEPDLVLTLDSLAKCSKPTCGVEVIVHLNTSANSSEAELLQNTKTEKDIRSWNNLNKPEFRLFCISSKGDSFKTWGAGMARKVAMDEALTRFNKLNRKDGVIVSLDADCTVSDNYLTSLYSLFFDNKTVNACSVYFEHPLSGSEFKPENYKAVTLYELYLRYYYQALNYSGFPSVFHTVGSAFAVRADVYAKAGGMSKHQAGEDFYFIQKTIPIGGYSYLKSACVYPSPRVSDRVPFGTGPAIKEIVKNGGNLLLSYNLDAFLALRSLLYSVKELYRADSDKLAALEKSYKSSIREFLVKDSWHKKISEINSNTASEEAFVKRFYSWFNMFKVVKFLNYVHQEGIFKKLEINVVAGKLLGELGYDSKDLSPKEMLELYRSIEQS